MSKRRRRSWPVLVVVVMATLTTATAEVQNADPLLGGAVAGAALVTLGVWLVLEVLHALNGHQTHVESTTLDGAEPAPADTPESTKGDETQ